VGGFEASSKLSNGVHCDFTTLVLVKHVLAKAGNGERNPPLTPPKRGIVESPPKRGIICAIINMWI